MTVARSTIDCHVHLRDPDSIAHLDALRQRVGLKYMNIVCTISRERVTANPAAFVAKKDRPGLFYVFASLDHAAHFSGGTVMAPPLWDQVDRLQALGADGIKMLENKPTSRKFLDIPVDDDYFAPYFARVEETGFPILWHVNDPEEFWDPAKTPAWAKKRGWGYDETFVKKEQLYSEVENVLIKHPGLQIIFAHFYFLSADLPRAGAFLDRFPNVRFDLAPGIEFLYNMSRDVEATRAFFVKYADRIVFGTDISSSNTPEEAEIRAGIITRWLETDEEYRVPESADFLLGPPEDGLMRGLSLPADVLAKIYRTNFEKIAGPEPKPLVRELALEECERIAAEVGILGGDPEDNHARIAVALLS